MDIAFRLRAQRRVERGRCTRAATNPQVAETTGTPMSRRVRGDQQTAREGSEEDDPNPEVVSKALLDLTTAPPTCEVTEKPLTAVPEDARLESAREETKRARQRLFASAEAFPAQAVTSRLSAVSALRDRARVARVDVTRADEHLSGVRAATQAASPRALAAEEKDAEVEKGFSDVTKISDVRGRTRTAVPGRSETPLVQTACPDDEPKRRGRRS
jgi:hypothetical protein